MCAHAPAQRGVRLMVDAEHSYFQPAIDEAVMQLQRSFNTRQPTIWSTYQCYRTVPSPLCSPCRHNTLRARPPLASGPTQGARPAPYHRTSSHPFSVDLQIGGNKGGLGGFAGSTQS